MHRALSLLFLFFCSIAKGDCLGDLPRLPEIYQDIWIRGKVIYPGVRSCKDRYEAIQGVLCSLPPGFKALDIGASQGYFSFRMAEDFQARCTMIEGGYRNSSVIWETGNFLRLLCKKNHHLSNLCLLEKQFTIEDFRSLREEERFDIVLAFSVIHHMRESNKSSFAIFDSALESILQLAPLVLIENPINTGDHTRYIRNLLIHRGGKLLFTSSRGTLTYEIYLFEQNTSGETWKKSPIFPSKLTKNTTDRTQRSSG